MRLPRARSVALALAILLTAVVSVCVPIIVDRFNDDVVGQITLVDDRNLVASLQEVQARGAILGVHGYRHEDFGELGPDEATEIVRKGRAVFAASDLAADCFVYPYDPYDTTIRPFDQSVMDAVNASGLPIGGLNFGVNNSLVRIEYTWLWRNMTTTSDPRYALAAEKISRDQPDYILLHAQDWNRFSRALVTDYLLETNRTNVTVQMDDFDVNTPPRVIAEYGQLMALSSVGQVILGVIPAGTWTGAETDIHGVQVNTIFSVYWWFFIVTCLLPMMFFVLWRYLSRAGKARSGGVSTDPDGDTGAAPSVSVIVPAYNEEREIARCIEALLAQDYPGPMEILVINDGSTDRTAEIARRYPVTVIDVMPNRGKSHALNTGISKATGEILVFTDSDSHMDAGAVRFVVRSIDNALGAQIVAGTVLINDDDGHGNLLRYCQVIEYRMEQEIGRFLQSLSGSVLVSPGPLFAVTREVVREIRFNEQCIIEDAEFTLQALNHSFKIIQDSDARVYTTAPRTLRAWLNQRHRWWYGNLQLWRMHRKWARRNAWMVLNYLGYVFSVVALGMLCLLPFLLLSYDNPWLALLRGTVYAVVPILAFFVLASPLFLEERRVMVILVPYALLYAALKMVVVSFLYFSYLTRKGVRIKFGAHTSVVV